MASAPEFKRHITRKYGSVQVVANAAELKTALSRAGVAPVVVDFFASWCGPCHAIAPAVQALAAEFPEVSFVKIEFDANKPLFQALGVRSFPTFRVYRGGVSTSEFSGASPDRLRATVVEACASWQSTVLAPSLLFAPRGAAPTASAFLSPADEHLLRTGKAPAAQTPPAARPVAAAPVPTPASAPAARPQNFQQALTMLVAENGAQRARGAVAALHRFVDNLVTHPGEAKFRCIRVGNPVFQDRVGALAHGIACLELIGFKRQLGPLEGVKGDADAEFLTISDADATVPKLRLAHTMLRVKLSQLQ